MSHILFECYRLSVIDSLAIASQTQEYSPMVTRIFLCDERVEPEIRDFLAEAMEDIAEGEQYIITWNSANIQTVKVGDRAYFKRIGSSLQGYFASGVIVPADREYQLRLKSARYRELSEAYDIDSSPNNFRVWIAIDAVVSYDEPLRIDRLRQQPQFDGMPLEPQTEAGVFREEYVRLLDREWDRFSLQAAKKSKGIRIVDVFYRWGLEDSQQGYNEDAIDAFTQAIKSRGNFVRAYIGRGDVYFGQKEFKTAIVDYTQAISLRPDKAKDAYYKRGLAYFKLGQYEKAIADHTQAIQIDAGYTDALFALGNTFFKLKSFEQAIANYSRYLETDPTQEQVWFRRGRANFILKEYPDAVRDFDEAIALKSDFADAYYFRGLAHSQPEFRDDNAAKTSLRQAAKLYKEQGKSDNYQKAKVLFDTIAPEIDSAPKLLTERSEPSSPSSPISETSDFKARIPLDFTTDFSTSGRTQLEANRASSSESRDTYSETRTESYSENLTDADRVDFRELREPTTNLQTEFETNFESGFKPEISLTEEIQPTPEVQNFPIAEDPDRSDSLEASPLIIVQKEIEQVEVVVEKVVEKLVERVVVVSLGEYNFADRTAVITVTAQYIRDGWQVRSVERSESMYDLECTKDDLREDVSIKSFFADSAEQIAFTITSTEVEAAKNNPNFVLWAVCGEFDFNSQQFNHHRWTGAELLEKFDLEPIAYLTKAKSENVQLPPA
jgi:tetratricopeptide (TPR) repeat protein